MLEPMTALGRTLTQLPDDARRIPYEAYTDLSIFATEQTRVFEGKTWNYLGLRAEIPEPGDFKLTWIGGRSVIFNRTLDGEIRAFVNQCAHRGAPVRRELLGNAN